MAEETLPQSMKQTNNYETTRKTRSSEGTVSSSSGDEYFEYASWLQYFVIVLGFVIFEIFCFQTGLFPFEMLGGPGSRLMYLSENYMPYIQMSFFCAILLHVVEAAYAYTECRSLNLTERASKKWAFQTFILGYASLKKLNAYSSKKTGKQKSW